MRASRNVVGGLGNLMFIKAFLIGQCMEGEISDTYVQQVSRWSRWATHVRATFLEGIKPGSIRKISLHIRRGDYMGNPLYVDLTRTDYYQKAIAYMDSVWCICEGQGEVLPPQYLVFCKDNQGWESDKADREWCREFLDKLIPGRYELASRYNKEEEDMNQMASCMAHIGANSSFSWWASFLGGGVCVMPQAWFVEGAQTQAVEMLPEWKLL